MIEKSGLEASMYALLRGKVIMTSVRKQSYDKLSEIKIEIATHIETLAEGAVNAEVFFKVSKSMWRLLFAALEVVVADGCGGFLYLGVEGPETEV